MLDIWNSMQEQVGPDSGHVIARVVSTWGSAPRRPGSALLISTSDDFLGSVSGGCVESAVVQEGQKVRLSGRASLVSFGVSDETAWSVGLTCGGKVSIFIQPHWAANTEIWAKMRELRREGRSFTTITKLTEDGESWLVDAAGKITGDAEGLPESVRVRAQSLCRQENCETLEEAGVQFFLHPLPAAARLIIIGAGHIAVPLSKFAHELGFTVTVIDPREAFINAAAFGDSPAELLNIWPEKYFADYDRYDNLYVALLSHDPKIDDPVFPYLFSNPVRYIGALGSRKTNEKRRARLTEAGFTEEQINRIHAPIGLSIGANGAPEIALSIIAQIIQIKNQS